MNSRTFLWIEDRKEKAGFNILEKAFTITLS